ncbi:MAG: HAMP domain-containing histidine kinase [Deltaproteobacteria bacterium]|nr:HAMP domain-containing histidine kinase [Deltaproteobacteria bacterium]
MSLFARLLVWFFTTVVAIGLVLFALFKLQFLLPAESPFRMDTGPRLIAVGQQISSELSRTPKREWDAVLERFSDEYEVMFILLSNSGRRLAGPETPVPQAVIDRVTRPVGSQGIQTSTSPQPVPSPSPQPAPHSRPPPSVLSAKTAIFSVHTDEPSRYWAGIRMPIYGNGIDTPRPATLLGVSDSMTGHGLFINILPFVVVILVILVLSSLLWLPLARSITRPIAGMMRATEKIAGGRFDVRVEANRADEIGRLGAAINEMSARLDAHVTGQKRFLGDVAHELASPLARIRLGLGILEDGIEDKERERVRDVQEEVQRMSELVDEILNFSRADLAPRKATIQTVDLAPLIQKVVDRERKEHEDIRVSMEDGLRPFANPEMLARALSNLIRNAIRYAGDAGPILVEARRDGDRAVIEVLDSGPGVDEEVIPRLFEPFYRPEASRNRDTGGVGLGLAIVKTCVLACRGAVTARNRTDGGFAVAITLDTI